jgi:prophage DNA circulation protein
MSARFDAIAESQLVAGERPNWVDQLRQASFRGVPFQVDTVDWTAGDNVVVREYPFQDLPTVYRMGGGAEDLKFSAYVIGSDYHLQRAALMAALTGEGVLMHPTAGAMRVFVAGKFTVKEAPTSEGGMARFELHFVRADARRYPAGVANTAADSATKATGARASAVDAFAAQWDTAGKPGWVSAAAVARFKATVDKVYGPIASAARTLGEFNSNLIATYQQLRDGLETLVSTPRQLADQVATLFELPGELKNAAARDFQAAFAWAFNVQDRIATVFEQRVQPAPGAGVVMYGTGNTAALAADTAARAQLDALTAAGDRLFESLAVASYVQATASVDLSNYDEALAMRAAVAGQVQRLLVLASQAPAPALLPATNWHDAMLALYTAALADLQSRSRDLVRLTTYTPESWQPVWFISHRLFGTVDYADEILAMNPHIEHPLLVPPGLALRIVRHE